MVMKIYVGLINNGDASKHDLMYGVYNIDEGYLCRWNNLEEEYLYLDFEEWKKKLPDKYMYFTVEVEEITLENILQSLQETYPELLL